MYYYGRELLFHGCYKKSAEILERFLDDPEGWVENKIDGTRQLALCKYNLKDEKGALMALLKGLEYDVPRGETCCDLGRHFMDKGKYKQAAYWLEQALTAKKATRSGAFVQKIVMAFFRLFGCVSVMNVWEIISLHRFIMSLQADINRVLHIIWPIRNIFKVLVMLSAK